MPVRNADAFVAQAIRSIQAQTYCHWEMICVDDGSSDDSLRIIRGLAGDRIQLLECRARGVAAAMNTGIQAARGPYVAVMHADDVSVPSRLERQVTFLEKHPEVLAVGSAARLIDKRGTRIGKVHVPIEPGEIAQRLIVRNLMIHSSVMARRSALLRVGLYSVEAGLAEDYDLWLRLVADGRLANLEDPLLLYRLHDGSLSARMHRQAVRDALKSRWKAVRRGTYSWRSVSHLFLPAASLLIPATWSRGLRSLLRSRRRDHL